MLIGAIVAAWALLVVLGAARAEGDGLPVPQGLDTTHEGVLTPDGQTRFLAIPDRGDTLLERVDAETGALRWKRRVPGEWTVPAVSLDGDTSGLAAGGGRLILIHPRSSFPQPSFALLVVDPDTLFPRREIELKGDFSFDAISPDGETVYLVEYRDPRDRNDYRLRRLALPEGRLLPGSLLPENDPGEEMRGLPMSRATGPGGRWEYTLYDGGATYPGREVGEPFVHALDTVGERTLCIDLDWITPSAVGRMDLRMSAGGGEVEVVDPRFGVVGRIDVGTGEAREVSEPFAPAPAEEEGGGGAGGAIKLVGAALLLGGAGLLGYGIRRRARPRAVGEAGA
jgi:hypothetical protein